MHPDKFTACVYRQRPFTASSGWCIIGVGRGGQIGKWVCRRGWVGLNLAECFKFPRELSRSEAAYACFCFMFTCMHTAWKTNLKTLLNLDEWIMVYLKGIGSQRNFCCLTTSKLLKSSDAYKSDNGEKKGGGGREL